MSATRSCVIGRSRTAARGRPATTIRSFPIRGVVACMVADLKSAPAGRGRPRDGALDERILEQVVALLGARGYTGLSLDELAVRSGVAKTTILRRWPSKAAVAAAGVERLALQSAAVPDSGALDSDLRALLHGARDTFVRGRGQFVARLL